VIKRGLVVEFNRTLQQSNHIPLKDEDKHSDDALLVEFLNTKEGWFSLHPRTVVLLSKKRDGHQPLSGSERCTWDAPKMGHAHVRFHGTNACLLNDKIMCCALLLQ
jgi:hypothetical protein